jgi:hypothetical protein
MADLLECLLQIKGLHGTIDRLAALVSSAPRGVPPQTHVGSRAAPRAQLTVVDLLARLAELEIVHGTAIRLVLTGDRPALPAVDEAALLSLGQRRRWSLHEAFDRFAARRRDNLELLDGCSADDLSRLGVHPLRRTMTLADLIAVMLASDVEHVGEIRRALSADSTD